MPYAVCQNCRRYLYRSGAKGARLADYCCPGCGSVLLRATKTHHELLQTGTVGTAMRSHEYTLHRDNDAYLNARAGTLFLPSEEMPA